MGVVQANGPASLRVCIAIWLALNLILLLLIYMSLSLLNYFELNFILWSFIRIFRDCRIEYDSEKRDNEKSKKLLFWWYQQIKIYCVQVFIFMKEQLCFYNSLKFFFDARKLFLGIVERTYYGPYMCHFLWL